MSQQGSNNSGLPSNITSMDKFSIASKIPHHPRFQYTKNDVYKFDSNLNIESIPRNPCLSSAFPISSNKSNMLKEINKSKLDSLKQDEEKLSPKQVRSLIKSFRKFTNRSKPHDPISEIPEFAISSPVLLKHRTAGELFPGMVPNLGDLQQEKVPIYKSSPLSPNDVKLNSPTSSETTCISSIEIVTPASNDNISIISYTSDSSEELINIGRRKTGLMKKPYFDQENINDEESMSSGSSSAKSVAKRIISELPLPPPVNDFPHMNSKSTVPILTQEKGFTQSTEKKAINKIPVLTKKMKSNLHHMSIFKELEESKTAKTATVTVLNHDELSPNLVSASNPVLEEKHVQFNHNDKPIKPSIPSGIKNQQKKFSNRPLDDLTTIPRLSNQYFGASKALLSESAMLIHKLQDENDFLTRELEQTKKLLALEIEKNRREVNELKATLEKFDSISCQSYEQLSKVTEAELCLEKEIRCLRKASQIP